MKNYSLGRRFHYDQAFFSKPIRMETLNLFQIGELCLEPGYEVAAHKQSCCEISYVISGKGSFSLDDTQMAVSAGDLIITPRHGQHAITASEDEPLFYAYMGFLPDESCQKLTPEIRRCYQTDRQISCRDQYELYGCFRKCLDEFYHPAEGSQVIIEACLSQMLVWTSRNFLNQPARRKEMDTTENPGLLVYRIMSYIDRNICAPLTVTSIADSLGYSPFYLSHLFRARTTSTLQSYISDCKIEKAKELIGLNRFTLTEIAEKLSYPNLQSFSRAFRAKTGVAPSAYQENRHGS